MWTKIGNICSGSNFERLRTVEDHPIFAGSYQNEEECTLLVVDHIGQVNTVLDHERNKKF